uniref:Uncharacterized protein n=1 Tax=Physcomitrium patens TaxID=3218 RepID=A0A2K1KJB7_PHYPA|nr:hypothetical protein PHYPA_007543 [Physcomitrium patens]
MRTARECRFCSLALKAVSIVRAAEDLQSASAVCSMTVEALGHTHPDYYCDTDTYEYISRLRFDLKVGGVKQNFSYSDGI